MTVYVVTSGLQYEGMTVSIATIDKAQAEAMFDEEISSTTWIPDYVNLDVWVNGQEQAAHEHKRAWVRP